MGEVAITFKVMPEGLEVNLDELKGAIETDISGVCRLQGMEEMPIAFGLKALIIKVVIEDAEGLMDRLESKISEVPGVQSIDVTEMGRLL